MPKMQLKSDITYMIGELKSTILDFEGLLDDGVLEKNHPSKIDSIIDQIELFWIPRLKSMSAEKVD